MKVARHEMPGKRRRRNRPGGYGYDLGDDAVRRYTQTGPATDRSYRSLGDVSERPGIACLATIISSLRDSVRPGRETKKPFSDFS
jgi:hypothetical protein